MTKLKVICPICEKEQTVEVPSYKDMWQEALQVLKSKASSKDDIAWAIDIINDENFQRLKDSDKSVDEFFESVPIDCESGTGYFFLNDLTACNTNLQISIEQCQLEAL